MFTGLSFYKSGPFAQFTGWDLVFLLEFDIPTLRSRKNDSLLVDGTVFNRGVYVNESDGIAAVKSLPHGPGGGGFDAYHRRIDRSGFSSKQIKQLKPPHRPCLRWVVCGRCLSSTRTHRPMEWKKYRSFLSLARSAQAERDNES
ncbi:hypothetical protein EVAR_20350_1 [Eumeta japonica]|uniref:Uncharacterized protein n=1 Tax=Eumeta variegata TaxID=151549 RepID=A0A4C1VUK9_EUMVA|nr:hypothetical protein EVAR_20350_1 [Eumeta japonica]